MEARNCQAENVESNFSFSLRTCFFTQFLQMNRKNISGIFWTVFTILILVFVFCVVLKPTPAKCSFFIIVSESKISCSAIKVLSGEFF